MTSRPEAAAPAREGQQILVRANVAADAREPMVGNASGEELVSDLCDDGAPWAKLAREALVVDSARLLLEHPLQKLAFGRAP